MPTATSPHRRSQRSRRSRPAPHKLSPTSQAAVAAGNQAPTNSALTTGPLLPQAIRPQQTQPSLPDRCCRRQPGLTAEAGEVAYADQPTTNSALPTSPHKLSPASQAAVAAGNQASPRRLLASPGCRLQLRPLDLQAKLLQKRTGFRHRTSDCPKQACTTNKAAKNLPPCLQVSDVRCALGKPTRFCIKVSARKFRGRNAVGCRGGQSLPGIHHSLTGTSAPDPGPRTPPVQTSDSYSALPVLPRPSPDYPWHPS